MPPYPWGAPQGDAAEAFAVPVYPSLEAAERMIEAVDWDAVREERLRLAHRPYLGDLGDEA